SYNPARAHIVIEPSREFLAETVPLTTRSHKDATTYNMENGNLSVTLENGDGVGLRDADKCIGIQGGEAAPNSMLLKNNGLHIDIQVDGEDPVGKTDRANVKDVVIESAISSIMDCEDSVTAVDADDKTDIYRNWLGLMRG